LFVAHFFHPVGRLTVEFFYDGDVRHGGGGSSAVPMFFAGREPDYISRANFLDRPSPALRQAAARGHNQRLPQRMRVPCSSCAWFERDTCAERPCWIVRVEQRIDPDAAANLVYTSPNYEYVDCQGITPKGNYLYLGLQNTEVLSINPENGTAEGPSVPISGNPTAVAVRPDGKFIYAAYNNSDGDSFVTVIKY
jgi:hypothetical protein